MTTLAFYADMLGDPALTQSLTGVRRNVNQMLLYLFKIENLQAIELTTSKVPLLTIDFASLRQDLLHADTLLQNKTIEVINRQTTSIRASKVLSAHLVNLSKTIVDLSNILNNPLPLHVRPLGNTPFIQFTGSLDPLMEKMQLIIRSHNIPQESFQKLTPKNQTTLKLMHSMAIAYQTVPVRTSAATYFVPDLQTVMTDPDFEQDAHLTRYQEAVRQAFSSRAHVPDQIAQDSKNTSDLAMQEMNDLVGPMFPGVFVAFSSNPVVPVPIVEQEYHTGTTVHTEADRMVASKFPPNNNVGQDFVAAESVRMATVIIQKTSRAAKLFQESGQYMVDTIAEASTVLTNAASDSSLSSTTPMSLVNHARNLQQFALLSQRFFSQRDIQVQQPEDTRHILQIVKEKFPAVVRDVLLTSAEYNLQESFLEDLWDTLTTNLPALINRCEQDSGLISETLPFPREQEGEEPSLSLPEYSTIGAAYRKMVSAEAYAWQLAHMNKEQKYLHEAVFRRIGSQLLPTDGLNDLEALDYGLPQITRLEIMSYNRAIWKLAQKMYTPDELKQIFVRSGQTEDPVQVLQRLSITDFNDLIVEYSNSYAHGGIMNGFWIWLRKVDYQPLATRAKVINLHTSPQQRATMAIADHSDHNLPVNTILPSQQGRVSTQILLNLAEEISKDFLTQSSHKQSKTLVSVVSARVSDLLSVVMTNVEMTTGDKIDKVVQSQFPGDANVIHQTITDSTWSIVMPDPIVLLRQNNTLLDLLLHHPITNTKIENSLRTISDALLRMEAVLSDPTALRIPPSPAWKIVEGDPSAIYNTLLDISAMVDFSKLSAESVPDQNVRTVLELSRQLTKFTLFPDYVRDPRNTTIVSPDLTQLLVQNYNPSLWSQAVGSVVDALPNALYIRVPSGRYPTHMAMLASSVGMLSIVPTSPLLTTLTVGMAAGLVQRAAPDIYRIGTRGIPRVGDWFQQIMTRTGSACQSTWESLPEVAVHTQYVVDFLANLSAEIAEDIGGATLEQRMTQETARTIKSVVALSTIALQAKKCVGSHGCVQGCVLVDGRGG